ncbi:spermidine synthase-like protein [Nitrogeniibacter mangrovi]|uniref:Spermidine synthase-like protein n=1 Tax=Nitrogeniibacter mangrovi TaxID=2016596 RepID=A0A6C1AY47_9RHOO|nr:spermidine synthase-like protein [Nitrogeniibacter mangrovi]QID16282.1 spermidine synthase-like protein [Nitrogeniibacter mangrovi]
MAGASVLTLASPFEIAPGTVLLHAPVDADVETLRRRLLAGDYPDPFVIDDGEHLTLYLGSIDLMQTVMSKAEPAALVPGYGPCMMAWLLFAPAARELALIGLGGGALAKFCHRHLPRTRMTAVETEPAMLAWRALFELPAEGDRFRVHIGDGAAFTAAHAGGIDVLMIDAFDTRGFAPQLARHGFVADAHAALARSGVLVANLAGPPVAYADFVAAVREVFDDQLLAVPVPEDGNHVLIAFKDPAMRPVWHRLHRQAAALAERHGLDLSAFVRQAERVGWRRVPASLRGC